MVNLGPVRIQLREYLQTLSKIVQEIWHLMWVKLVQHSKRSKRRTVTRQRKRRTNQRTMPKSNSLKIQPHLPKISKKSQLTRILPLSSVVQLSFQTVLQPTKRRLLWWTTKLSNWSHLPLKNSLDPRRRKLPRLHPVQHLVLAKGSK